ncbi:MAG: hypothetical protein LBB48_06975 [Treponema sp.]|jgi:hypothetical protein|nr:hypothetical protein [Treponema sp.]
MLRLQHEKAGIAETINAMSGKYTPHLEIESIGHADTKAQLPPPDARVSSIHVPDQDLAITLFYKICPNL